MLSNTGGRDNQEAGLPLAYISSGEGKNEIYSNLAEAIITTVNCFSHRAHFSKLPTGGLGSPLPPMDHKLFETAVYSSSDDPSYSPLSFAFFFALDFAAAVLLPLAPLRFFAGDSSSTSSS